MTTISHVLLAMLAVSCARDAKPTTTPPIVPATMHAHTAAHDEPAMSVTAMIDPGSTMKRSVGQAVAVLHEPSGGRVGTVQLTDVGREGVDLVATIDKLPAGTHAYHVHVYGDCSATDFKSAGPHFHFTGSSFDNEVKVITGNLGELTPDAEGRVSHRSRIPFASLHGEFSLLGRSIVIHEKGNDPAVTPDGGAGARIACGVIGIANADQPSPTATR